ncbi:sporulation integral membrane protein YtvI [Anaerocolumna sp.]|uniref:sporulation integral membrane protein YtvI n=1 Tax=Anaerocolumna sp. TaxID=2041569 RepID=UPI0028A64472|nr:sporulation integral membrane protein YtvI [Anaerocolumna sp.]
MIHLKNKTKLIVAMVLTIIGVYFGFQYILPLFAPFVIAYFIAWILMPSVNFLNKKLKFPRVISAILSLGVLGSLVIWIFCYLGNIFIKQLMILLQNMPIYLSILSGKIDSLCNSCDNFFGTKLGTIRGMFDDHFETMIIIVRNDIMPSITTKSLNIVIGMIGMIGIILITLVSSLLLIKDDAAYKKSFRSSVLYQDIHLITGKLSETGVAYLRTQVILMAIVSVICTVGLLIIKNKYAMIIGLGIGLFDAFPMLGSGAILIPWSIISLFNQDVFSAAILMTIYFIIMFIRQFLEPKLLGNRIGIKPVFTLMSMYVGFKLFGLFGFILGPLGLVIIITIVKETEIRLAYRGETN